MRLVHASHLADPFQALTLIEHGTPRPLVHEFICGQRHDQLVAHLPRYAEQQNVPVVDQIESAITEDDFHANTSASFTTTVPKRPMQSPAALFAYFTASSGEKPLAIAAV